MVPKKILCKILPRPSKPVKLPESEKTHALKVLRLGSGDIVQVLDGEGNTVFASLKFMGKEVYLEIQKECAPISDLQILDITVELAILKNDAMSWSIEKMVELGVKTLIPVLTDHCVVQIQKKGAEVFLERWQKIADQALKQCGRLKRMEILAPMRLEELFISPIALHAVRFWADEKCVERGGLFIGNALEKMGDKTAFHTLIGPEGGWSQVEREMLSRQSLERVNLGSLILRAETAAVYSVSLINGYLQRRNS